MSTIGIFGTRDTHPSGGFGFRNLAKVFNLRAGIDISFSEEGKPEFSNLWKTICFRSYFQFIFLPLSFF